MYTRHMRTHRRAQTFLELDPRNGNYIIWSDNYTRGYGHKYSYRNHKVFRHITYDLKRVYYRLSPRYRITRQQALSIYQYIDAVTGTRIILPKL